jgi:hypothetical protein
MKYIKFVLLLVFTGCFVSLNADYRNAYFEIFFGRQPSSRAEALGMGYVTVDNDISAYYFNPAGITNIDHSQFKLTTSSPFYALDKGRYYQIGLGHNSIKDITIGLNVNFMSYGEEFEIYNEESFETSSKSVTPTISNYILTLAKPLTNALSIGCNINYFNENYSDNSHSSFFFDAGSIYKHKLQTSSASQKEVSVGLSIKNFTFSKVRYNDFKEELPVISRIGLSYSFIPNNNNDFIEVFCQTEYKHLLNYDYRNGLHSGLELKFFNMISLRCGYYSENIYDYGSTQNESKLSDFTYGFGIDVPIYKYTKIPFNFQIDYTSLDQVSHNVNYNNLDKFRSITIKINLIK